MNNNISIIVPVYKVEKYIARCVESILTQTYNKYDCVFIDDGSPDRCGQFCDECAYEDARIISVHQVNGGLSSARNTGIDWAFACSDSQWLTFIDSDDWIHLDYLYNLYNAVKSSETELSVCHYSLLNSKDSLPTIEQDQLRVYKLNIDTAWLDSQINTLSAWGYLYKKILFRHIRYPIGKIYEDRFTTHKIVFQCNDIAVIYAPLYFYCNDSESITRSRWSYKKLEDLEAEKEQIAFFRKIGKAEIEQSEHKAYLNLLARNIIELNNDKKFYLIQKQLIKELRTQIKRYKKQLNLHIGNNEIYCAGYPAMTRLFCICKAIICRIREI